MQNTLVDWFMPGAFQSDLFMFYLGISLTHNGVPYWPTSIMAPHSRMRPSLNGRRRYSMRWASRKMHRVSALNLGPSGRLFGVQKGVLLRLKNTIPFSLSLQSLTTFWPIPMGSYSFALVLLVCGVSFKKAGLISKKVGLISKFSRRFRKWEGCTCSLHPKQRNKQHKHTWVDRRKQQSSGL